MFYSAGGSVQGDVREPDMILRLHAGSAIDIEGVKIIQSYEGNSL